MILITVLRHLLRHYKDVSHAYCRVRLLPWIVFTHNRNYENSQTFFSVVHFSGGAVSKAVMLMALSKPAYRKQQILRFRTDWLYSFLNSEAIRLITMVTWQGSKNQMINVEGSAR
jgi:hypothetical protein